jgi:hypothetical protein
MSYARKNKSTEKNGKGKMFLNGGILGVFPTCSEKNNTNACLIILIIFF